MWRGTLDAMTTSATVPVPTTPESRLAVLLDLTADAWAEALAAVAEDDASAARRVLAGARERRAAAVRARAEAQSGLADARIVLTARRLVRSANTVQLVADLYRLEELIVVAARRVLSGRAHVRADLHGDVLALGDDGARRLHDLVPGRTPSRGDRGYLACGRRLDDARACLVRRARAERRPDEATALCAALVVGLLEASRHAGRAA